MTFLFYYPANAMRLLLLCVRVEIEWIIPFFCRYIHFVISSCLFYFYDNDKYP